MGLSRKGSKSWVKEAGNSKRQKNWRSNDRQFFVSGPLTLLLTRFSSPFETTPLFCNNSESFRPLHSGQVLLVGILKFLVDEPRQVPILNL